MVKGKGENSDRRALNFSPGEIQQLKSEIANRKGILFASLSSTITYKTKELEWSSVAAAINKVDGHGRTVEQIKVKCKI